MMKMIENILGFHRITVEENQRAIVLYKGRFAGILGPGEHRLRTKDTRTELHDLNTPEIVTPLLQALFRERPDIVAEHFVEFAADTDQVLIVARDGRLNRVLRPENRVVVWQAAGPWTVETLDLTEGLEITPQLAERLVRAGITTSMTTLEVPDAHVGLMTVDGAMDRQLAPGTHRFWNVGRKLAVRLIDTRWRTHDVVGQDILTADRVTLRVNLAADFRVTDPGQAAGAVKDFEEALHRALQFAFRKTLGAKTLDQLLGEKVTVDAEVAVQVRTDMAAIGVEVGAIALKDVILPGDMREILNSVVQAEKEAEANVIRRREETNATRSLLNTAKVMAENPVMLRLKELEALEAIAGKVERLTVHSGTDGLMNDLVRLRD